MKWREAEVRDWIRQSQAERSCVGSWSHAPGAWLPSRPPVSLQVALMRSQLCAHKAQGHCPLPGPTERPCFPAFLGLGGGHVNGGVLAGGTHGVQMVRYFQAWPITGPKVPQGETEVPSAETSEPQNGSSLDP